MKCTICRADNPASANACVVCAASLWLGMSSVFASDASPEHAGFGRTADGERRRITVLFADVKGSTALVLTRDAEDADAILEHALATMIEAVAHFGGTLNQTRGDGIMALFGVAVAHEDHALRACLAALRMQDALERQREESSPPGRVCIRVGVHTGEELIRPMTGNVHMAYAAVGHTSYLAAKLEQSARPGRVLVSKDVAALVEGHIAVERRSPLALEGVGWPVDAFELGAVTNAGTRFQAASRRGLAPFVGRENELRELAELANAVEGGQGRAAGVVGDPGVGKTRLLWEFRQRQEARGWLVLGSTSSVRGAHRPLLPVIELLCAALGALPADGAGEVIERLRALERSSIGDAPIDITPLLVLLDLPVADERWRTLDPPQRRARMHDALVSVFERRSQRRPTIVAVEDAQWADGETAEYLDRLVGSLAASRLLVLIEHRPEHRHRLDRHTRFSRLRIDPLSHSNATVLFRSLAGVDPSLAGLERAVLQRADGNPFFLEELVRSLGETGVLVGEPGNHRLGRPIDAIAIPTTVKNVLAARIARLAADERALLQTASVIGKTTTVRLLAEVASVREAAVAGLVESLLEAGLLTKGHGTHAPEVQFKHAFTQEVGYESLLRPKRKQMHGRVADALELQGAGGSLEHVERLAHHCICSERWDRALQYLQLAARRAFDGAAMAETVRFLEQAIAVVASSPPSRQALQLAIDLRLELRNPLLALGKLERVIAVLREAEALADAGDDAVRRCRVAVCVCGYSWLVGEHSAAVEAGERALSLAGEAANDALLVPVRQYLAGARHDMGDHACAQALLSANIDALRETPVVERHGMTGLPIVFALAVRGWSRGDTGDFDGAYDDARRAFDIAAQVGHGFSIQGACFVLACLDLQRGEWCDAVVALQEAIEISRKERHRFWMPALGALQALALAYAGRLDEALQGVTRALPDAEHATVSTVALLALCEVHLRAGQVEAAARHTQRALGRSRQRRERGWEAAALRLLGEISECADTPDLQVASAYYAAALQRAEELSMRPLAARSRLSFASTQLRMGAGEQAKEELAQAEWMLEEMRMSCWTDRARAPHRPCKN